MSEEGLGSTTEYLGDAVILATELLNDNSFDLEKTKEKWKERIMIFI